MLFYKCLYKFFDSIFYFFYKKYTLSKLNFISKEAKKTCSIGRNVKIYNSNVLLGKDVILFDGVIIWGNGEIKVSDGAKIGLNTIVYASKNGGGITIGKYTAIAGNCYIIDKNHTTDVLNLSLENPLGAADTHKLITIGDNVWVAANCVVAMGSYLHDGCVIGANSFVNNEIPENAIAVGSPAKVVKYRGGKTR